jgi:uncharacterized membrane protein YdjX (TVP38/TMEM64 family)
LQISGFPLTNGAGFVFGFYKGFLLASVSSTLGATAAFLVARYLAQTRLSGWMEANKRYKALDRAVTREGYKIGSIVAFTGKVNDKELIAELKKR